MIIRFKVEKVNKAFKTKKLVYVTGQNLETGKHLKGFVLSAKVNFIAVLKKAKETNKQVIVSVSKTEDGFVFINAGNQEINEA